MEACAPSKVELKVDKIKLSASGHLETSKDFSVDSLRRYIVGYIKKI